LVRRALIFGVLLYCFAARPAAAQVGLFLKKGTSGYGADAAFAVARGYTSIGVDAGASHEGWADAGLGIHHATFKRADMAPISALAAAPAISVHPLKQGDSMPLSLAVGASMSFVRFSSADLDAAEASMTGRTYGISATTYRFFRFGERFGAIPGVSVSYGYSSTTMSSWAGTWSDSSHGASIALGGHLAYAHDSGYIITLTPSVTRDSSATTFSFALGAIKAAP
jgi:hypothetical protein